MRNVRWSALLFAGVLTANVGCSGKRGGGVMSHAEASTPPQAPPLTLKDQEKASADAIRGGSDDEDEVNPKKAAGAKKWRDTGVYLDGRPIANLSFGELPIALKPVFIEERVSSPIEPGHKGPGFTIIKQRQYRFTDYLKSLGVDLAKVKELHVYGPKFTDSVVVGGAELRKKGKSFMFRFGSDVQGKALPVVPDNFGNDRSPDKITAVMIYVEKTPPKLIWNEGFQLDGHTITNVPYYGDPMRGGVRVYKDDRYALSIKRPLLRETEPAATLPDGTPSYKLYALLEANEVDMSKVAEAWVVHHERRTEKLTRDELAKLTFVIGPKGQNEILLGDKKIPANAIALHSRPLKPEQLPKILPEEEN
jgi:hypothetical protein